MSAGRSTGADPRQPIRGNDTTGRTRHEQQETDHEM
jgi:hypothetical protein